MQFTKAVRKQAKGRVAIAGPAGAGKTYSALIAAQVLAQGGKIALIDTERESASLYADEFDFDVIQLDTFNPALYEQAIRLAEENDYAVIVIDSLSHAWEGVGGLLDTKGKIEEQRGYNSWTAWRKITPMHEALVDAILRSKCHVIATLRSKMEYEQVDGTVKKIGMAPVQRQGMEYEFTLFCDMDVDHSIMVSKSRSKPMSDKRATMPDAKFWQPFLDWLNGGEAYEPPKPKGKTLDGQLETYEAKPTNGRPFDAETLRSLLQTKAGAYRTKGDEWLAPPQTGHVGALVGKLNAFFSGDETMRHTLLRLLTGHTSSKKLDKAMTQALLDWIEKDSDMATREATAIVAAEMQRDMVGELWGKDGAE